jgi:glycerol-1-phosphate dehydrogenase [NAD(P)+]
MLDIDPDTSFLLVVGSGSLTDLTRYISSRTGIPFVSVPTAVSMDGYASPGAAMLHGGFKKSIAATHPQAIIADVDVLCQAPYEMTASGFGDLLGKLNSRVDWQLSNMLTGEYYCEFFVDLIDKSVKKCIEDIAGIRQRKLESITRLMEGQILSGIAMLLIGNSRPASGSEHNLSHYWEMKAFLEDKKKHFHGTKVGVGTGLMAKFYEKFFARDPHHIDLADAKRRKQSLDELEDALRKHLGPVGEGIFADVSQAYYLEWEEQQKQIKALQFFWEDIKKLQALEPTFERIAEIQRAAGASIMPEEVHVDRRARD